MTDVFEVLSGDHAVLKRMLNALQSSPDNSTGAPAAVVAARKAVAEQLVIDFSAHEAAEERYFWPAVRERLPDGSDLADHAIEQEAVEKQMLNELGKLGGPEHEFDALIDTFIPACRAHIEFEEAVTPAAPAMPGPAPRSARRACGAGYRCRYDATRPHGPILTTHQDRSVRPLTFLAAKHPDSPPA